jgi:hypothetical protein
MFCQLNHSIEESIFNFFADALICGDILRSNILEVSRLNLLDDLSCGDSRCVFRFKPFFTAFCQYVNDMLTCSALGTCRIIPASRLHEHRKPACTSVSWVRNPTLFKE